MKTYRVGILGASGAVGREMLKVLAERHFPISELRPLSSKKSAGQKMDYEGKTYTFEEATHDSFRGLDLVLGAAANPVALAFKDDIVKAGALFIDNSSAFRMEEDVPLVVPEINREDIFLNHGVIANPNCSTIITLMAIKGIARLSKIVSINAATYQATSGAGIQGPLELFEEMDDLVSQYHQTQQIPTDCNQAKPQTFPYQIAGNVIPCIGNVLPNGYTKEEMKMQNEGRKILHLPNLFVTCTCVRVPVARSHSIAVTVVTEDHLEVEAVKEAIRHEAGCRLYDDAENGIYPMPLLTSDQDMVYVGRIRKDLINPEHGISLFCCGDQIRKGAATNAVEIAQAYIQGK